MGKLTMNNNWKTSVGELLGIFREALLAIIPWLEKAKIKWKEGEAYDDWDNIAEALYKNIVCSSLAGEIVCKYTIAEYNFDYDDYASIDFIEVRSKGTSGKKFAFVSFQSNSSPLDSVKVAELNKKDQVVGYSSLKFDSLEFFFVKNINGKKEVIDNIGVEF
jgi:hypothetical protein